MIISNVNTGICHRRVQEDIPPFFVNWSQDGENNYKFFHQRFMCERLKNKLIKQIMIKIDEEGFKDFFKVMYPDVKIAEEGVLGILKEFQEYANYKNRDRVLDRLPWYDIRRSTVKHNKDNKLLLKGYYPGFIIEFTEFTKAITENLAKKSGVEDE